MQRESKPATIEELPMYPISYQYVGCPIYVLVMPGVLYIVSIFIVLHEASNKQKQKHAATDYSY